MRQRTAADLGRAIGAGEIDPVALTEAYLDAIAAHPDSARIYAHVTAERARAEAAGAALRAREKRRLSPLDGVPISWKDLFDSAGSPTEAGTALMKGRTPDRDARALALARQAGLVCLGKTHLSEIAFSGLGYNPITATPPNVTDALAVPGGSSSGAAASVAFGLAAAAMGTDTGGSIRVPAGWNDLTGFKPTHGAVPMEGVVPLCASFDTGGPLCRSVEDAALILAVLTGTPAPDLGGATLEGTRLLIPEAIPLEDLDGPTESAFDSAVDRFRAAGAEVIRAPLDMIAPAYALSPALYAPEAWAEWRGLIEANPSAMFPEIYERTRAGADVSAADYISAWSELRRHRAAYAAATAGVDAVICPTTQTRPPKLEAVRSSSETYRAANLSALRNTRLANLMGLCAVSLPTGVPACGVMLNAAAGSDRKLLRLAKAAETALA